VSTMFIGSSLPQPTGLLWPRPVANPLAPTAARNAPLAPIPGRGLESHSAIRPAVPRPEPGTRPPSVIQDAPDARRQAPQETPLPPRRIGRTRAKNPHRSGRLAGGVGTAGRGPAVRPRRRLPRAAGLASRRIVRRLGAARAPRIAKHLAGPDCTC